MIEIPVLIPWVSRPAQAYVQTQQSLYCPQIQSRDADKKKGSDHNLDHILCLIPQHGSLLEVSVYM